MRIVLLCALLWSMPAIAAPSDAPRRVLFLGNSLTYSHDLPALVQAMAASAGHALVCVDRSAPDFALEDHWHNGARHELRQGKFDVVVLQQGPSTLPASRANLRTWAKRWSDLARECGTEPVLAMVWPYATQREGFLLASTSYREAAEACAARVFPSGEAWALALHAEPGLALYAADGLHPTREGSYLAALVVAHGLTGLDPLVVPPSLTLADGSRFAIDPKRAELFRRVVRDLRDGAPTEAKAAAITPASR